LKVVKWGLAAFGLAAVLGVIAVSAGALGGVAQAQEPAADKASRHQAYQEKLAQKLGVSVDQLAAAQKAARDEMIDEAVAAGRITAEQAEKIKSGEPGAFRQGRGARIKGVFLNIFESAASILGLTNEQVRAGLQEGKSLNDLATEKGVGNFEAQLVAKLTADVQAKLADGSITQAQADRLLENLAERVSRIANHEGGKMGEGLRGRFAPGGPGGRMPAPPSQN
jgi:polyhydroxyalkanoate synthesis regulator phasin